MSVWQSVRVYDGAGRLLSSTIEFAPDGAKQAREKAESRCPRAATSTARPCGVCGGDP